MDYLFFDIECSDGKHICEFGYVITDEHFNELDRNCILINPQTIFKLFGRSGEGGITLSFSEKQYRAAPAFPKVYDEIKALLEREDRQVVGFAANSDEQYLFVACRRYKKEKLNFRYADAQKIYAMLFGEGMRPSLENAVKKMDIPIDVALHRSDNDAYLTMLLTREMCKAKNCDVRALDAAAEEERKKARNFKRPSHYSFAELIGEKGIRAEDLEG